MVKLVLGHPFSKEIFPNIQSKPPLVQLEAISSRPIASYLGEETDPHLSTASFQVVVESDKVSPQPPFLQARQPQFPQPLLIRLALQTLHQLRCPSLDTLQHLHGQFTMKVTRPNQTKQRQKAASQVATLASVPTMGEEQLGSVKVEDNVGYYDAYLQQWPGRNPTGK
ncbi:hypothetical protein QYF61_018772, partial [Mycteria americana]